MSRAVASLPDDARARLSRALTDQGRRLCLEFNASKPHPNPICRDCHWIYEARDRGVIYRGRCGNCDLNRVDRILQTMVGAFGQSGARAKLEALGRQAAEVLASRS
jgi:hypothetical protein